MIYVVARFGIAAGKFKEYMAEVEKLVTTVRSEEGCVGYEPCTDVEGEEEQRFLTIIEMWESEAHWRRHMAAPHMAQFRTAVEAMQTEDLIYAVRPI